jgi:hypothetical protein
MRGARIELCGPTENSASREARGCRSACSAPFAENMGVILRRGKRYYPQNMRRSSASFSARLTRRQRKDWLPSACPISWIRRRRSMSRPRFSLFSSWAYARRSAVSSYADHYNLRPFSRGCRRTHLRNTTANRRDRCRRSDETVSDSGSAARGSSDIAVDRPGVAADV